MFQPNSIKIPERHVMKWINLEKYGAELKRVELSNGTKFPAIIITDVAKYNSSGAMPLSELKQENNLTAFEKLGGNKGRNAAQPVLFLTNTFSQDKRGVFNIYDNLAKLLNITRNELVDNLVTENIPDESIILTEGFIDPNFHKIVQNNAQEHYGRNLYVPKQKSAITSLLDLEKELLQKQHSLFPKANVGRIPLATLDKFGYDSSIVSKGFLSTADAYKAGFQLHDLDTVTMQGDKAILPLSINTDSSVNFINNIGAIPQLSYSNLEWKSNLNLIKDYEAVVATRELCRDILNTKASQLSNPSLMENHIERLSSALQDCYQLGNGLSTAKLMKYDNGKTFTFISKNADNEWRYIEKDFSNKEDLPLNEQTFKKALETLASNSLVISSALSLSAPQGAELKKSLDVVLKNQLPSFAKFAKMDAKADSPTLNEDGKKIHKTSFDKDVREIQPNRGETLYEKQVVSFLNSGEIQSDLSNIVGSGRPLTNSEMDEQLSASMQPEKPQQSIHNDAAINFLDDVALAKAIVGNFEATDVNSTAPTIDQYLDLPKGLKGVTPDNYEAINETFKAVQYLEIVALPKLNEALVGQQTKLKHVTDQVLSEITLKTTGILNNQESDPTKLNDALRVPQNLIDIQEDLSKGVTYFEDRIAVEQIKLNLLTYRLNTKIGEAPEAAGNLAIINVTSDGYAKQFNDAAELETAKKAIYAHQVLNLPQDQFGIPTLVEPNHVLDEASKFVKDNYVNVEPQQFTLHSDIEDNLEKLEVTRNREVLNAQPISAEIKTGLDKNIALALINNSPTLLTKNTPSTGDKVRLGNDLDSVLTELNTQLTKVSNETKIDIFADAKLKVILDGISQSKDNILDPDTDLQVGAIAKLRLITDIASKSLNDLAAQNDIGSITLGRTGLLTLRDLHESISSEVANNTQDINRQTYASFLLARQSANALTKESNQVWGMYDKEHPQAYRVNAYDRNAIPDDVTALSSPSYSSAVNEAYTHFQFAALVSSFGLQKQEVEVINTIAALTTQDKDKANELLQAYTGRKEISVDNFNTFDSKTAKDLNIATPEATDIFVKIAMLGKVLNVDTKTPFSELTNSSSKDHVPSIQNLLQPNLADLKHSIENIQANNPNELATKASNQIIADAFEANHFKKNSDLKLTVFSAEHKNDVAFARFVPSSWGTLDSNPSNKQYLIAKPDASNLMFLSNQLSSILQGKEGFTPALLIDTNRKNYSSPEQISKKQLSNDSVGIMTGSNLEETLKINLLKNALESIDPSVKEEISKNPDLKLNIVTEYNNLKSDYYPTVSIQPHTQEIKLGQALIKQIPSELLKPLLNSDQDDLKQASILLNSYSQVSGIANDYSFQNVAKHTPPEIESKQTFIPNIKPDDVLSMKPSQIAQDINLDAAWLQPKFEDIASPDSKTLDAAVLAQMCYHSFPKNIPQNVDVSIERNANVYLYAINETQKALLNSRDLSSTINGLSAVNTKLNNYAPTYFSDLNPEDKKFKDLLSAVAKIEKSNLLEKDMPLALNNAISANPLFIELKERVAEEYNLVKSKDSAELQASIAAQQPNEFNNSLLNNNHTTPQSIQNKWNYKLHNSNLEGNVVKIAVIEEAFNQLHKNLGGSNSSFKPSDLGKNITINLNSGSKDANSDINIGENVPRVAVLYEEIQKTFINNIVNNIINNEVKVSGHAADVVIAPTYQATTPQMQALTTLTKNDVSIEIPSTAETIVNYSKELLEQNKVKLNESDKSDPAVQYVIAQTEKLMERQNKLLNQIESKAERLLNQPNVEMLDYMILSDSVNKISNASINTSAKEITSYFEKKILDEKELKQTVNHVQATLSKNSDVHVAANDVLNSNAVHRALKSIVNNLPDKIKSEEDFLQKFKENFSANFGQHSNVTHEELRISEPNLNETLTLTSRIDMALKESKDNSLLITLAKLSEPTKDILDDDLELKKQQMPTLEAPKPI